jgi:nickel-dependent lactate racemase
MLHLPYGKTTIPFEETGARVLRSRVDELVCSQAGGAIVRDAMAHPVGCERLSALAAGKRNCVLIVSDHTRPVPSKDILPLCLPNCGREPPKSKLRFW